MELKIKSPLSSVSPLMVLPRYAWYDYDLEWKSHALPLETTVVSEGNNLNINSKKEEQLMWLDYPQCELLVGYFEHVSMNYKFRLRRTESYRDSMEHLDTQLRE